MHVTSRFTPWLRGLLTALLLMVPVLADPAAPAGGGQAAVAPDPARLAASRPSNGFSANLEIPRAWISPTQPSVGQSITFTAQVSGSDIESVKVYYALGGITDPYPLLTLTLGSDGNYSGTMALPSTLAAGAYSQFRVIATDKSGNRAYWPGVIVSKSLPNSGMSDLAGKYGLTDPTRTSYQYHGDAILQADGTGRVREFLYDMPIQLRYPETADAAGYVPVLWRFDVSKQSFVFDWTNNGKLVGLGYFTGSVSGNTSRFTLSGNWSNGSAGQLTLQRVSD
ncbi:hypothetical protein [Chitinimonas lacunae]|uniref:Uncharacterized protein n=1 Tax=Chitinimonas lacunae TaxID=1963018 RepID=A0ABV8MQX0_9NEIS